jgi:hypothetical protein
MGADKGTDLVRRGRDAVLIGPSFLGLNALGVAVIDMSEVFRIR